ncbi:MAG: hypothetical protein M1576_04185, partial [Deltaproteobacteria bacterium]|nr:hypothetical protein [Deltaproteobacteria bacterium]
MKITVEVLKEKNACQDGIKYFQANFKEKEIEVKEVLQKLVEDNKYNWASWVVDNFKNSEEVEIIEGDLISDKPLFFLSSIKILGSIKIKGSIEAGGYIEAD